MNPSLEALEMARQALYRAVQRRTEAKEDSTHGIQDFHVNESNDLRELSGEGRRIGVTR
jgi:hypothetical protein